jgi:hypothetical protein
MRTGPLIALSIPIGFISTWPLGALFEAMHWPVFHGWGLAHGAFIVAWPLLSILSFAGLRTASRYFRRSVK